MAEPEEIPADVIEAAKARDARLRIIELAIDVEAEIQKSPTLRLLLDRARKESAAALEALATINPADTLRIIELQAAVYRARSVGRLIGEIIEAGRRAETSIREDDSPEQPQAAD